MNILGLILAPFIYIYNLLFKPSDYLVKADIAMDSWSYFIDFDIKENSSNILSKTFLQYLARYFFICDDRQDEPMKEILLSHLKSASLNTLNLTSDIEGMIYNALNDNEKEQLASLARNGITLPALSSRQKLRGILGKYSFNLMKGSSGYNSLFFMSPGLDIVLLSRTVAFMLAEITGRISKDEYKKMKIATIEFLEKIDDTNFKNRKYVVNLANIAINRHLK